MAKRWVCRPNDQFATPRECTQIAKKGCLVNEFWQKLQNLVENLKKYQFLVQTQIVTQIVTGQLLRQCHVLARK